jgi:hypothetical protein
MGIFSTEAAAIDVDHNTMMQLQPPHAVPNFFIRYVTA